MRKADVTIVLGRGIHQDGSLPNSVKAATRKAVELYKQGKTKRIIFSGKWSYTYDYTPPTTEAKAMSTYSEEIGLPREAVVLEEESFNTISNFYFIKKLILLSKKWCRVILINYGPADVRARYLMETMLGPKYDCQIVATDYQFPPEKAEALKISEAKKVARLSELMSGVRQGDHEAIFNLLKKELGFPSQLNP